MNLADLQTHIRDLRRLTDETDRRLDQYVRLASQLWDESNPRWQDAKAKLSKGFLLFQLQAVTGDLRAIALLGCAYLNGWSIPKSPENALPWLRHAAEQGHPLAQVNYGYMLTYGKAVPVDEPEGVLWFQKAADQGDLDAYDHLCLAYLYGRGVAQDDLRAAALARHSASSDERWGLYLLGFCYENGRGVAVDRAEAIRLYRSSAEQGYAAAKDALTRLKA